MLSVTALLEYLNFLLILLLLIGYQFSGSLAPRSSLMHLILSECSWIYYIDTDHVYLSFLSAVLLLLSLLLPITSPPEIN